MQYMQTGGEVRATQLIDLLHHHVRLPISRPIQQITRPSDCRIGEHGKPVRDKALFVCFGC
jgi:hypothetical protein